MTRDHEIDVSIPASRLRFTVEDFERMATRGVLRDDARLELIDGEIFEMAPYDRAKLVLYAAAGIQEVWLVDIDAGRVEIHRGGGEAGYRDVRVLRRGETVTSLAFPDIVVGFDEVLG